MAKATAFEQRKRRKLAKGRGEVAQRMLRDARGELAACEVRAQEVADEWTREVFLWVLRWAHEVATRMDAKRGDYPDWAASANMESAAGLLRGAAFEAAAHGFPSKQHAELFFLMIAGHIGAADALAEQARQNSEKASPKPAASRTLVALTLEHPDKSAAALVRMLPGRMDGSAARAVVRKVRKRTNTGG